MSVYQHFLKAMPRFTLKQSLLGIAVIAAGLAALLAFGRFVDPFDNVLFTPTAWAKGGKAERAQMSADLVNNHLPNGLSKAQVARLIGAPDWILTPTDPTAGLHVSGVEAHAYDIDGGNIFAALAFVCVNYDANGRVIDAQIASDN